MKFNCIQGFLEKNTVIKLDAVWEGIATADTYINMVFAVLDRSVVRENGRVGDG